MINVPFLKNEERAHPCVPNPPTHARERPLSLLLPPPLFPGEAAMSEGGKRSGMRFLARGKEEGKGKKWMVTTAEEEKEGGNTGRERGWVLITIVSRRRPADEFCGGVNALVEIEVHTHTYPHFPFFFFRQRLFALLHRPTWVPLFDYINGSPPSLKPNKSSRDRGTEGFFCHPPSFSPPALRGFAHCCSVDTTVCM